MISNIIELSLVWHRETEKAICASVDEDAEPVWLPKSLIDYDPEACIAGIGVVVSLPELLAVSKGLV